jgi:hypothetical protein
VAEQLRGASRIPELLVDGGPERVPELVRMSALKTEAPGHLITNPRSATRREPGVFSPSTPPCRQLSRQLQTA